MVWVGGAVFATVVWSGTGVGAENGGSLDLGARAESIVDYFCASVCDVTEHIHTGEKINVWRGQYNVTNGPVGHVGERPKRAEK